MASTGYLSQTKYGQLGEGEIENERTTLIKPDGPVEYDYYKRNKNEIPYMSIYEPVEDNKKRSCFLPNEPVKATIISVQRNTTHRMHVFNPYVYTVQLQHGRFSWRVGRRYKDFYSLHNHFLMFRAAKAMAAPFRKIPGTLSYHEGDGLIEDVKNVFTPTKSQSTSQKTDTLLERRKTWTGIDVIEANDGGTTSPPDDDKDENETSFPFMPDSLISDENIEQRRTVLEGYLNRLLSTPEFRDNKEMLEFLEVSHLSFVNDFGDKGKEGLMKRYSGGHHQHLYCLKNPCKCCNACRHWQSRWLVIKESYVAYLMPYTNTVREVLLFDSEFEALTNSYQLLTIRNGLVIRNFSRDLVLKFDSDHEANEWKLNIDNVLQTKGKMWKEFIRFGSFYPVRSESYAKWFIDGSSFFDHCAEMLNQAEEEIFITDWWLTPEVFLRRPADIGSEWQLMEILRRKSKHGVRVYVMLFKEVNIALFPGTAKEIQYVMNVGSAYAKKVLKALDPNIQVVRHPDPVPIPSPWTHHEKMVVIDQRVAFIGGIDLNFGRFDDFKHKLTDLGPKENIVIETLPRNQSQGTIPMIDQFEEEMHHHSFADAVARTYDISPNENDPLMKDRKEGDINPKLNLSDVMKKYEEYINSEEAKERLIRQDTPPSKRKKGRIGKAIENWKEKHMPQREPDDSDAIYAEYEKMIKRLDIDTQSKLWIGKDYVNWYLMDVKDVEHPYIDLFEREKIPRLPWHDLSSVVYGAAARDAGRHFIQRWNQIKTDKFNYDDKYTYLVPKSYDDVRIPKSWKDGSFPCSAQVIRSGSLWSCGINCNNQSVHQAYIHIIEKAEHYVYIENQFFISLIESPYVYNRVCQTLADKIIQAHKQNRKFRVYILLPLMPGFAGELGTSSGINTQAVLYWTYKSILRGPNSLLGTLEKEIGDYSEYIGFYSMRTHADLCGTLVTEAIYIHSKGIVVDDRYAIIGSANLNDRSLKGNRDSEVCIYIEDTDFIDSQMDSQPYKSGVFAGSFRRHLLCEHLGLLDEMGHIDTNGKIDVSDVACDEVFNYINQTAKANTNIYEKVFGCYPSDSVRNWIDLDKCKKEKDNCLANKDKKQATDLLSGVEGYLVEFPLKFLSEVDLTPSVTSVQSIGYLAVV